MGRIYAREDFFMSQIDRDKIKGAWLVMHVTDIVDVSEHLSYARGTITDSNFLSRKRFEMPVVTKGFEQVEPGDVVKMVYFTTKSQLDSYIQRKSAGFIDIGLSYYRLDSDGCWQMVYEDWGENSKTG